MSIIAAGAGLLARGVGAFFSGETSELRQQRREERRGARQERRGARQAEREAARAAEAAVDAGYTPPITRGDVPTGGVDSPRGERGKTDFMELAKKYWWAIALVVLFFTPFGKKLMGPTRRNPTRRRAKPKTVIRYRTRKAPVKRRR